MPPVSPDGQMNLFSLQEVAHVNPSRSRGKAEGLTMSGIFGQTSIGSSKVLEHPLLWESKLAGRLGMLGSTESLLIWKDKTTPQGRSIYQLAQSTPRTVGTDCTGWPTPTTRDHKGGYRGGRIRNGKISNDTLDVTAQHTATALWPTTAASDSTRGADHHLAGTRPSGAKRAVTLATAVVHTATWPTPTAVDRVRSEETLAKCAAFRLRNAGQKTVPLYLGEVVANTVATGVMRSGLPDQTGKLGALNPAFSCWLMGFPQEWESSAPLATPSSRKSRQK